MSREFGRNEKQNYSNEEKLAFGELVGKCKEEKEAGSDQTNHWFCCQSCASILQRPRRS